MLDYFAGLDILEFTLFFFIMLAVIAIEVFYLLSLYKAMEAVPEDKRVFPSWFVWLMIIPIVGFVFAWIMEPFGIPKSFAAAAGDNQLMKNASNTLFGLGLAHMILVVCWFLIINFAALFAAFIVWIIYWVKVVNFKNTYLLNPQPLTNIQEPKNKINSNEI